MSTHVLGSEELPKLSRNGSVTFECKISHMESSQSRGSYLRGGGDVLCACASSSGYYRDRTEGYWLLPGNSWELLTDNLTRFLLLYRYLDSALLL